MDEASLSRRRGGGGGGIGPRLPHFLPRGVNPTCQGHWAGVRVSFRLLPICRRFPPSPQVPAAACSGRCQDRALFTRMNPRAWGFQRALGRIVFVLLGSGNLRVSLSKQTFFYPKRYYVYLQSLFASCLRGAQNL